MENRDLYTTDTRLDIGKARDGSYVLQGIRPNSTFDDGILEINGDSITSIGPVAFFRLPDSVSAIIIQPGITHIYGYAFKRANNTLKFTAVYFPDTIESIAATVPMECSIDAIFCSKNKVEFFRQIFSALPDQRYVIIDGNTDIRAAIAEYINSMQNTAPILSEPAAAAESRISTIKSITHASTDVMQIDEVDSKKDNATVAPSNIAAEAACDDDQAALTSIATDTDISANADASANADTSANVYANTNTNASLTRSAAPKKEPSYEIDAATNTLIKCELNLSGREVSNITDVTVPDGIRIIANAAFISCSNTPIILKLPSTLTLLELGALLDARIVRFAMYDWGDFGANGSFETDENGLFLTCKNGNDVILKKYAGASDCEECVIPDNITVIDRFAFCHADRLTKISIPSSVREIRPGAFYMCKKLTEFVTASESFSVENGALYSNDNSILISYPTANKLSLAPLSANVRVFGEYCMAGYEDENPIYLPNGCSIADNAFELSNISTLVIPGDCTSVGNMIFDRCVTVNCMFNGNKQNWIMISDGNWLSESVQFPAFKNT